MVSDSIEGTNADELARGEDCNIKESRKNGLGGLVLPGQGCEVAGCPGLRDRRCLSDDI